MKTRLLLGVLLLAGCGRAGHAPPALGIPSTGMPVHAGKLFWDYHDRQPQADATYAGKVLQVAAVIDLVGRTPDGGCIGYASNCLYPRQGGRSGVYFLFDREHAGTVANLSAHQVAWVEARVKAYDRGQELVTLEGCRFLRVGSHDDLRKLLP